MTRADRQAARGQECTLVILGPSNCASTETTVLAHAPCEDKGKGFKSPDWWAAFSCSVCHDLVDRRIQGAFNFFPVEYFLGPPTTTSNARPTRYMTDDEINEAWLRGIYRTIKIRRNEGLPY